MSCGSLMKTKTSIGRPVRCGAKWVHRDRKVIKVTQAPRDPEEKRARQAPGVQKARRATREPRDRKEIRSPMKISQRSSWRR